MTNPNKYKQSSAEEINSLSCRQGRHRWYFTLQLIIQSLAFAILFVWFMLSVNVKPGEHKTIIHHITTHPLFTHSKTIHSTISSFILYLQTNTLPILSVFWWQQISLKGAQTLETMLHRLAILFVSPIFHRSQGKSSPPPFPTPPFPRLSVPFSNRLLTKLIINMTENTELNGHKRTASGELKDSHPVKKSCQSSLSVNTSKASKPVQCDASTLATVAVEHQQEPPGLEYKQSEDCMDEDSHGDELDLEEVESSLDGKNSKGRPYVLREDGWTRFRIWCSVEHIFDLISFIEKRAFNLTNGEDYKFIVKECMDINLRYTQDKGGNHKITAPFVDLTIMDDYATLFRGQKLLIRCENGKSNLLAFSETNPKEYFSLSYRFAKFDISKEIFTSDVHHLFICNFLMQKFLNTH